LFISNCVINLTTNKVDTFKEVHRILKQRTGLKKKAITKLMVRGESVALW
jgi:hypothetical protein